MKAIVKTYLKESAKPEIEIKSMKKLCVSRLLENLGLDSSDETHKKRKHDSKDEFLEILNKMEKKGKILLQENSIRIVSKDSSTEKPTAETEISKEPTLVETQVSVPVDKPATIVGNINIKTGKKLKKRSPEALARRKTRYAHVKKLDSRNAKLQLEHGFRALPPSKPINS